MQLTFSCLHCQQKQSHTVVWPLKQINCVACGTHLFEHSTDFFLQQTRLDQCPLCGGAHLYRRKDFNQKLGIFLVILGVALAYFTYGVSLVVVTLIDFCLFRKVRDVGICYRCQAQFRNSPLIDSLPPFDLELFDYYLNLATKSRSS